MEGRLAGRGLGQDRPYVLQRQSVSSPAPIPCNASAPCPATHLNPQEFKKYMKRQQDKARKKNKRECPVSSAAEADAMRKKRKDPALQAAEADAKRKKRSNPLVRASETKADLSFVLRKKVSGKDSAVTKAKGTPDFEVGNERRCCRRRRCPRF